MHIHRGASCPSPTCQALLTPTMMLNPPASDRRGSRRASVLTPYNGRPAQVQPVRACWASGSKRDHRTPGCSAPFRRSTSLPWWAITPLRTRRTGAFERGCRPLAPRRDREAAVAAEGQECWPSSRPIWDRPAGREMAQAGTPGRDDRLQPGGTPADQGRRGAGPLPGL